MTASDIMSKNVIVAHSNLTFTQLCRLFFEMKIHHLPILDESEQIIGIVSANDALKAYSYYVPTLATSDDATVNAQVKIEDIMTEHPRVASPDLPVEAIAKLFTVEKIHSLPIIENSKLVGIVTSNDLLKVLANHLAELVE